jgi:hypothetical protein
MAWFTSIRINIMRIINVRIIFIRFKLVLERATVDNLLTTVSPSTS